MTLRNVYEELISQGGMRPEEAAAVISVGLSRLAVEHGADTRLLVRGILMSAVQVSLIDHCGMDDDDTLEDAESYITSRLMETLLRQIAKATE